jgi:hypothetical protein
LRKRWDGSAAFALALFGLVRPEAWKKGFDALTSNFQAAYTSTMRTTLTLDDDLAGLLKERAQRRGVPFKVIVNEALRESLGAGLAKFPNPPRVIPHSFGFRPGIDLDRMNQLADELEAEAFADSWGRQVGE